MENPYLKPLLLEGDTYIFINYPIGVELYHPTGSYMPVMTHRVNSAALLATGSAMFEKLLGYGQQQLFRKQHSFFSKDALPSGIRYVIDLTPSEAGEEGVGLMTMLSCSLGLRHWALTSVKCGIDYSLVGGKDVFVNFPNDGQYSKIQSEYCPIRHRFGVEELLRTIVGQGPTLDSAPKVWTLFALSKYFECTALVAEPIVKWMLSNYPIIEILPEVSYEIGLGLKSQIITRSAFSVLVSEAALSVVSRRNQKFDADDAHTNQFGRARENVDKDDLKMIDAAAVTFEKRIRGIVENLLDPEMAWFEQLPEFRKIGTYEKETSFKFGVQEVVKSLVDLLRHYVRGRIASVGTQPLCRADRNKANTHRRDEQYLKPYDGDFATFYDNLTEDERFFTRFYWKMLSEMDWKASFDTNNILHSYYSERRAVQNIHLAETRGIAAATFVQVAKAGDDLNDTMVRDIKIGNALKPVTTENPFNGFNDIPFFSTAVFLSQVHAYIHRLCETMLSADPSFYFRDFTDTIVCLTHEEFKYLPLWADENSDFQKIVPVTAGSTSHVESSTPPETISPVAFSKDGEITEMSSNISVPLDNGRGDDAGPQDDDITLFPDEATESKGEGNKKGKESETDEMEAYYEYMIAFSDDEYDEEFSLNN